MAEWVGLISVGLGDLLLSVFRPPHHADRAPYNKYYQFQVGMVKGMVWDASGNNVECNRE